MAFRIKSFTEIVADMLGYMRASQRRVTDFNVGAVNRVLLESAGAEVDELYQSYAQGLIEAIPTAIYRSFEFDLRPALAASGMVRFTAQPNHPLPVVIPAGFLLAAGPIQYQVAVTATIPVGELTAEVLAVCTTPGLAGNAPANAINALVSSAVDLAGVTNLAAFTNGRGMETEAERKLRFVEFVRALARGTSASCVYVAKQAQIVDPGSGFVTERVARCEIEETPGHVDMWIHNGAGSTSEALRVRADELVQGGWTDPLTGLPVAGYRPTGMRVDVLTMREIAVEARLRVQAPGSSRTAALSAKIVAAAAGAIRGVRSGESLLPVDLVNAVLALRAPVQGAEVAAPLLAVPCPISAVLVPGAISIEWL